MFWTFQKKFLVAHGDTIWQLPNLVATQRSALRNQIRADQNRIIQKKDQNRINDAKMLGYKGMAKKL
jgi:hypothetical protein